MGKTSLYCFNRVMADSATQERVRRIAGRLCKKIRMRTPAVFVVDQRRGRATKDSQAITIPLWALRKSYVYTVYYIAHELAHIARNRKSNKKKNLPVAGHDRYFYKWFKLLCPVRHQFYELKYKPRNAVAAGVRMRRMT